MNIEYKNLPKGPEQELINLILTMHEERSALIWQNFLKRLASVKNPTLQFKAECILEMRKELLAAKNNRTALPNRKTLLDNIPARDVYELIRYLEGTLDPSDSRHAEILGLKAKN